MRYDDHYSIQQLQYIEIINILHSNIKLTFEIMYSMYVSMYVGLVLLIHVDCRGICKYVKMYYI